MQEISTKRKSEISLLGALAICAVAIILNQLLKIHSHEEHKIREKVSVPGT